MKWFDDYYNESDKIPFEQLYGIHILSGFEYTHDKFGFSAARFILDGETYDAVCDPDDGWRSSLGGIFSTTEKCAQNIPDIQVEIMKADDKDLYGVVFIVRDKEYSARPVIWLGTDHNDAWYPYCVHRYEPENFVKL